MLYVTLTGTGLEVSRICLGTMTFGGQVDEKAGAAAVDRALERGVNFLDTANIYTGGKSEAILAKALAGRRDKCILATKLGQKVDDSPNGAGLSRVHILREMDNSLRRLNTDYVDILYLHAPDAKTPPEETLAALEHLIRSGKARYIGASNFAAWQMAQLWHLAGAASPARPIAAQVVYNPVTRGIEQELVPFLEAYRLGLIVYNPLAGGLLTEKYGTKTADGATRLATNQGYRKRYWNDENLEAWDSLHRIASDAGLSLVQLALRWPLGFDHIDSILVGFSSLEQLDENLVALDGGKLGSDVMAACDGVWAKLAGTRFKYNR